MPAMRLELALCSQTRFNPQPRANRVPRRSCDYRVHAFEADLRASTDLYRQALVESEDGSLLRAEAEQGLAVALMRMLEDLPAACAYARSATELAEEHGDAWALAEYVGEVGLIECLMGEPSAGATMQRALSAAQLLEGEATLGDLRFIGALWGPRFMPGVRLLFTDDLDGARRHLERAYRDAVDNGEESAQPLLLRYLATLDVLSGDWGAAERRAAEGYDGSVQTGQTSQQAVLAAVEALVHAHRGRVDAARASAEEALALGRETGHVCRLDRDVSAWVSRALARQRRGSQQSTRSAPRANGRSGGARAQCVAVCA
jgi:tetratricopeptide (TPR) repeat protein